MDRRKLSPRTQVRIFHQHRPRKNEHPPLFAVGAFWVAGTSSLCRGHSLVHREKHQTSELLLCSTPVCSPVDGRGTRRTHPRCRRETRTRERENIVALRAW